jgi:hypothetical protein
MIVSLPVSLSLAASLLLTIIFTLKRRRLEAANAKTFRFNFYDKSLEFLRPFTIIGALYLVVAFFVAGTSDTTTVARLISYEKFLLSVKGFVAALKLGTAAAAILVFAIYLLTLARVPSRYTEKLLPFFKKYKKTVATVYTILVILCAFTFFGSDAGTPAARLRFRITRATEQYGELRREVEQAASKEIAGRLYARVYKSLPPQQRDDIKEQRRIYPLLVELRGDYATFKAKYDGKRNDDAEGFTKNDPPPDPPPPPAPRDGGDGGGDAGGGGRSPAEKTSEPPSVIYVSDEDGAGEAPSPSLKEPVFAYSLIDESAAASNKDAAARSAQVPPDASPASIERARAAVRGYGGRFQNGVIELLKSEQGRELAIQPPKIITSKIRKLLVKSLAERYPVLESALDSFTGAFDKALEERTGKMIDRITAGTARDPANAPLMIEGGITEVVAATKTKTRPTLSQRARAVHESLKRKLQSLTDAIANLRRHGDEIEAEQQRLAAEQARVAEVDQLIKDLACHNEERRDTALEELPKYERSLTREQVEAIEGILPYIDARRRQSRRNPRVDELVPVRYYAAKALTRINSEFVTGEMKELASNIVSEVDRSRLQTVPHAEEPP